MSLRAAPAIVLLMAAMPGVAQDRATEAARAAIARIERDDDRIGAVIALDPTALDQARALDRQRRVPGPLHALPVLLKDNIDAAPLPTTAGSLALAANVPARDAPLVTRLRAAGAVILGKTNLSEWANFRAARSISGWSGVGGQTRNPHALDRSPCGSSSGSGAAVAAGFVTAAIGTETDGSITCPAAMNGIVGLKPTVGLVSRTGIVPISASQDTAGPMTADVRTAALLLNAIAGSDPEDVATRAADAHRVDYAAGLVPGSLRGPRIGVLPPAPGEHPAVRVEFDRALAVLRAEGAVLVEIVPPRLDEARLDTMETLVLRTEFKAGVASYLASAPPAVRVRSLADLIAFNAATSRELALFGQETFVASEATRGLADPAYVRARTESRRITRGALDRMFAANRVVALVAPTAPPAIPIDAAVGDVWPGGSPLGTLAAISGYPHLTVPMGAVRALPLGLSFVGPAWSEARLLALGYGYEQAARAAVAPRYLPSVEAAPEVTPLLRSAIRP